MAGTENHIAKNSILLYIRMLITMCISLYTSRAILNILGVTDFGIYNVVGGVVSVLGFFNGSLAGASTRFITYAIGIGNHENSRKTFNTLIIIHNAVALILVIVIEIIGIWFLYNKMNIPTDRIYAAFWVLQCSILTLALSLISVPFNAVIIAYERMDIFAIISVCESIAKLGIVYLLLLFKDFDKLIVYSVLIFIVQICVRISYGYFCKKNFSITQFQFSFDKTILKKILVFIGWKINGDLAFIGCNQGINIVLNLFFGPVVNAARGISVQIQNLINTFIQNYQMAVQPQIIKSYANGNYEYTKKLIINSSKFGFYLMILVAFPLLNYTDKILEIWLTNVPTDTAFLVQIILFACFISPLRQPLIQAINATGNIKRFQIIEGTTLLLAVPIVYLELKYFNFSLSSAMLSYLCIEYLAQVLRTLIVLPNINMRYIDYSIQVLVPILKVSVSLYLLRLVIIHIFNGSTLHMILGIICGEIFCIALCIIIGMTPYERKIISGYILKKIK